MDSVLILKFYRDNAKLSNSLEIKSSNQLFKIFSIRFLSNSAIRHGTTFPKLHFYRRTNQFQLAKFMRPEIFNSPFSLTA